MPLTKRMQVQVAEEVGRSLAKSYFEIFNKPSNCGPNFTWEHFPEMCRSGASTHVMLSYPHGVKAEEELKQIAGMVAYAEAKRLVESTNAT